MCYCHDTSQGGGFFIPGLEGYRLRLALSLLTLGLIALNRFPGYDPAPSQITSEAIGCVASLMLLVQVREAQLMIIVVVMRQQQQPDGYHPKDHEANTH